MSWLGLYLAFFVGFWAGWFACFALSRSSRSPNPRADLESDEGLGDLDTAKRRGGGRP